MSSRVSGDDKRVAETRVAQTFLHRESTSRKIKEADIRETTLDNLLTVDLDDLEVGRLKRVSDFQSNTVSTESGESLYQEILRIPTKKNESSR